MQGRKEEVEISGDLQARNYTGKIQKKCELTPLRKTSRGEGGRMEEIGKSQKVKQVGTQ